MQNPQNIVIISRVFDKIIYNLQKVGKRMSQAKVDRYKEEKKNRAKNIKKKKIKTVTTVIICAALVGVAIGFPLGKELYKRNAAKIAANETITAGLFEQWFDEYWVTNGYSERTGFATTDDIDDLLASDTDADIASSSDSEE